MIIKRYQGKSMILFVILSFLGIGILGAFGYTMGNSAGNSLTKIHPLTYLAVFLCFYRLINNGGPKKRTHDKEGLAFVFFTLLILIYLYYTNNLYSVSFIIDTFICPVVFWILFRNYNLKYKIKGIDVAVNLAVLNSGIALAERVFSHNIFPITTTYGEIFRSTALLGHPLNNALITFVFVLYTLSSSMTVKRKMLTLSILILGLVCFGARGCLYSSLLAIILLYAMPVFFTKNKYFTRVNKGRSLLLLLFSLSFIGFLGFNTSIGERLMDASFYDSNANVRMQALDIIDLGNMEQYLWAKPANEIDMLSYNTGVGIIENFFIAWILKFGLIIALLLLVMLYRFLYLNLSINSRFYKHVILILFFAAAATNNSLATNTQVLGIFLLIFCSGVKSKMVL